ncbi:TlpA disulfide reductase family protein [Corynebacterium sp. 335C]
MTPTPSRRAFLRGLAAAGAAAAVPAGLAACSSDDTAGHDAVAIGGTFEFVSPGGETVITYPPADRRPVGDVFGEPVVDPGREIHLSDFAGQIVVLNAWGQWCAPCRSESDDLQAVHERMQADGIGTVLGVNVRDHVRSAPADFMRDNGLTYPSIYDPPFVNAVALGGIPATVIPTTIILDREHRPAVVLLKETDQSELWGHVEAVAAEGA